MHLPVQSGSTRILRAMRRTYTREEYLEKIAMIRAARRPISVTSDIIVGFPGETEEDFEETLSLAGCRAVRRRFRISIFAAPQYTAQHMPDAIPEEEKGRRLALLHGSPARNSAARATNALIGQTFEVLVDGSFAARGPVVGSQFQQPHSKFHFAASEPSGTICSSASYERQPEQSDRRAGDLNLSDGWQAVARNHF